MSCEKKQKKIVSVSLPGPAETQLCSTRRSCDKEPERSVIFLRPSPVGSLCHQPPPVMDVLICLVARGARWGERWRWQPRPCSGNPDLHRQPRHHQTLAQSLASRGPRPGRPPRDVPGATQDVLGHHTQRYKKRPPNHRTPARSSPGVSGASTLHETRYLCA